jgi:branched-chain amino acid aminotransferase
MAQIPFDKITGKIWLNGESIDWQEAKIHILTHGLHYGTSVFEGIRVYDGKPFKLHEHMIRLKHSADVLGMNIDYSADELDKAAMEQIEANEIQNGYMRPVAWRGSEEMLIGGASCTTNVAIAVWKSFESKRSETRDRGIKLTISKWRKPQKDSSPFTTKAASIYTLASMVKNEAVNMDFDDGLMLDEHKNVTEASTSNIFFIKGNELHTPYPDCFLNGITRQTVVDIAAEHEIKLYERFIKQDDIQNFDAAFLTGTAIEIMPIQCIDNKEFETQHELIKFISNKYSQLV